MIIKRLFKYQAKDGSVPFDEWIFSKRIDSKTRYRVLAKLDQVSLGNLGDCKAVGGGVSEIKLHFGPGYRIYIGQKGNKIIILLCGGDKSTQKKDIKNAHEYWHDYKERSLK